MFQLDTIKLLYASFDKSKVCISQKSLYMTFALPFFCLLFCNNKSDKVYWNTKSNLKCPELPSPRRRVDSPPTLSLPTLIFCVC